MFHFNDMIPLQFLLRYSFIFENRYKQYFRLVIAYFRVRSMAKINGCTEGHVLIANTSTFHLKLFSRRLFIVYSKTTYSLVGTHRGIQNVYNKV